MKTSAKQVGGNQSYIVNGMLDNIDYETLEYSLDNGATWYTEDEIKEALEAKSKSCENCNHYKNIDSYMPSLLECSMKISQHQSDSYFLVDEDLCCNKHEPKIIKALEK